ncbi:acyltransferase family protein [Nocardioides perillae]|uniref:Fucose 4-O-acetylase-like acetyltransferase n=1 Tax=Nocardioides perillae TaxID=1119534 RepID=A0A7Y9RVJ8_9ACTN|nr:fucose 4-O-acetylase-like acetyltransferase [Nocardioides perillae]
MAAARDPWFDNAKMTLVTLVVIGHGIAFVPSSGFTSHLYDAVYYVHIPAFVLLTGHLSARFAWDRKGFRSLLTTLVVPYVVFEALMAAFRVDLGGEEPLDQLWIDPHWPMWYLAALFCWRLMTPVLRAHWLWVPASVGVSLLGPLTAYDVLDVDRVLGLLPFYVLGLHLRREQLALVRLPGMRVLAVAVLAWIWWTAGQTDQWIRTEWLYYRSSYDEMDAPLDHAVWARLTLIAISSVGTLALLALVPRRASWWSRLGAASMVVYLCHGFVVRGLEYADFWDRLPGPGPVEMAITAVVGTAIAVLLAWPPVAARLTWLVDPVGSVERHRAARHATGVAAAPAQPVTSSAGASTGPAVPAPRTGSGPQVGGTAERGSDSSEATSGRAGA